MDYTQTLWLFLLLVTGIIVVPGMDMIFVLVSALSGGRSSGLTATAGMMAGSAVHTLYGTLGAGLLVTFAPGLFLPLLVVGALYMVWIGLSLVRSSITVSGVEDAKAVPPLVTFRRALATCLLNPKAYLFVLAVYPQFLRAEFGPFWMQGLVMGVITAAVQFVVYGAVALAGTRARALLVGSPAATVWTGRAAGLLLIAAAGVTFWQGYVAWL